MCNTRVMRNLCQYPFKKGPRKGQLCNKECVQGVFCSQHTPQQPVKLYVNQIDNLKEKVDVLKQRIIELDTTLENKAVILKHYNNMKRCEMTSTEYYKNQIFVDLALSYPWNKTFDITEYVKNTSTIKVFLDYLRKAFDNSIYGMDNVKTEITNLVCKLITNPKSQRNNIALCGAPGVGKSRFIKVLADVLDIPLKVISLGGIKDSSFFLGHGYVYVESGPGKIVQNIIDAKINNPIIYFDELDKVSETDHGKDIYSFMCYLTDPTQNTHFSDHYFYGMTFDLSKVFYVFTFNDISKIDKILLDRLNVIHVGTPSQSDTAEILYRHCLPEIVKNVGISKPVMLSIEDIRVIMKAFMCNGIREYYRILEKFVLEINKDTLMDNIGNICIHDTCITLNKSNLEYYIKHIQQQIYIPDANNNYLSLYT